MKKLTTISLFIFWMVVTAILSASLLYYQNNKDANKCNLTIPEINKATSSKLSDPTTSNKVLNLEEITKHNTRGDCWLLISGKIYNVTSYIVAHPGGAPTIVPTCGTDATQAYNTKNRNNPHSGNAHALLADYYIGDLNQETTTQQIQQNVQTTNTITPPPSRGDDEEEDDD